MSETGFDRLIAMAGQDMARDLIGQFRADLAVVSADLDAGFAASNAALLRDASHVLISLAGTVGATTLHDAARRLNDAAESGDGGAIEREMAGVKSGVREMEAELATRAAAMEAGT